MYILIRTVHNGVRVVMMMVVSIREGGGGV
jgi:hypothetical protein